VIVPSPPIVKFTSEPLLAAIRSIAEAELGAATCAISGLVPLSTFQLKVWFVAAVREAGNRYRRDVGPA